MMGSPPQKDLLNRGSDLGQNIACQRMFAGFLLGVEERVAVLHLVDATTRWNQRYLAHFIGSLLEYLFRQPGGFLDVASRGAIFDRDRLAVIHAVPRFLIDMAGDSAIPFRLYEAGRTMSTVAAADAFCLPAPSYTLPAIKRGRGTARCRHGIARSSGERSSSL